jgi:Na+-transporting NADH:ubiquinone oxidoreductase subunit NqrC
MEQNRCKDHSEITKNMSSIKGGLAVVTVIISLICSIIIYTITSLYGQTDKNMMLIHETQLKVATLEEQYKNIIKGIDRIERKLK